MEVVQGQGGMSDTQQEVAKYIWIILCANTPFFNFHDCENLIRTDLRTQRGVEAFVDIIQQFRLTYTQSFKPKM